MPESLRVRWASLLAIIPLAFLCLSGCASVPEEVDNFTFAALSGVRDFNIGVRPIPDQLQHLQNPYGVGPYPGCEGLWIERAHLLQAIERNKGRRVGYRRDSRTFVGRFGNLRDSGVKVAARTFTPYRGVLRQITGAAAYEQAANRADRKAHARLGYIIGQARAYQCPGF